MLISSPVAISNADWIKARRSGADCDVARFEGNPVQIRPPWLARRRWSVPAMRNATSEFGSAVRALNWVGRWIVMSWGEIWST
eukprot:scaffold614_cov163-Amphora_coffeaeformis.AAC.2